MVENNPLVSVCIITYNCSKFILETLESVKSQTYQNIELVISDDCSIDNTVNLCQTWIEKNTILLTVLKNSGVTANCNRVTNVANGEWIKLIGGDDLLINTCIADNVEFTNKHPKCYIVESGICAIDEKSNMINKQFNLPDKYFHNNNTSAYYQHRLLLYMYPVNILCVFYKKNLLNAIGYFDESIPQQEDVPFILKVTQMGYKIYYFPFV